MAAGAAVIANRHQRWAGIRHRQWRPWLL